MQKIRFNFCFIIPIFLFVLSLFLLAAIEVQDCKEPDGLREVGLLSDAQKKYAEILKKAPGLECAQKGITKTAEKYFKLGDALRIAHDKEGATDAYRSALKIDPSLEDARKGLEIIFPDPFSQARKLRDIGLHNKALEAAQEALKSDPNMPRDLQYLTGGEGVPFWWEFLEIRQRWATPLITYVGLLLIAFFVIASILPIIKKRRLQIGHFENSGLKTDISSGFAAMLRTRLQQLTQGVVSQTVENVKAPVQSIQFPNEILAAAGTPITWFGSVLSFISLRTRKKDLSVSGLLHAPGERGAGISLQLMKGTQVISSHTLWQHDFVGGESVNTEEQAATYYHLAELAAIWLLFEIKKWKSRDTPMTDLLWTDSWEAYAYYRSAVRSALLDQSISTSRTLYIKSLERDPKMRAARLNLSYLMMDDRDKDTQLMKHAEDQIEQVLLEANEAFMEKGNKDLTRYADPTRYGAAFSLAVLKVNLKDWGEAYRHIQSLYNQIQEALQNLGWRFDAFEKPVPPRKAICIQSWWVRSNLLLYRRKAQGDTELQQYLFSIRPGVAAMLAGVMRERGCVTFRKYINIPQSSSASDLTQYNLACSYSMFAEKSSADKEKNIYTNKSFTHLELAFWLNRQRWVSMVEGDESLRELRKGNNKERLDKLVQKYS